MIIIVYKIFGFQFYNFQFRGFAVHNEIKNKKEYSFLETQVFDKNERLKANLIFELNFPMLGVITRQKPQIIFFFFILSLVLFLEDVFITASNAFLTCLLKIQTQLKILSQIHIRY